MVDSIAEAKMPGGNQRPGPISEVNRLQEETEQARAELERVKKKLRETGSVPAPATELVRANEALVSAALHAQTEAETAKFALDVLSRSAALDELTGLPTRALLRDRLTQAIGGAKRRSGLAALLFVDLDNFKQVNDTLGHPVGDLVLQLAAKCLTSAVREADTVSRHGGDEFVILLADVSHASDAILIADKVLAALGASSTVGGHVFRLTASIGISVYPDDGDDADMLIERADAAMYRAKRQGPGNVVFHSEFHGADRAPNSDAAGPTEPAATPYTLALAEHERRQAQLRDVNEQLVLAALSAQALQAAAERAQRRQTEFMAMLAHELRSPLNPIRASAATLGRPGFQEPMLPRVRAVIERQVAHLSRLVDDLLDVSRAKTGKLRIEPHAVDLQTVVDAAIDACRAGIDARHHRFVVQMPAESVELYCDPMRLAQVLTNLLDNATKYTPEYGEIGLVAEVVGNDVVMTVSDTGIGIASEALSTVFEPFVQDPHAVHFNGVGLGIGLTVVRELAEAHGGSVTAASAGLKLGSRFIVTLPQHGP